MKRHCHVLAQQQSLQLDREEVHSPACQQQSSSGAFRSPAKSQAVRQQACPGMALCPLNWQEYFWTPARLAAWLDDAEAASSSCSLSTADTTCVQRQSPECLEQLVPQHLRQLLILLLQAAADTGHAQDLIWTPARLADWMSHNELSQTSGYIASFDSKAPCPGVWQAEKETCPPRASHLQRYVERLPLVSSVAASKAEAARAGAAADSMGSELSCRSLGACSAGDDAAVLSSCDQQAGNCCAQQAQPQLGAEGESSSCAKLPHQPLQSLSEAPSQSTQPQQQEDTSMQPCQQDQRNSSFVHGTSTHTPAAELSVMGCDSSTTLPQDAATRQEVQQELPQQPMAPPGQQQQKQPQLLPLLKQLQRLREATGPVCDGQRHLRHGDHQAVVQQLPCKEALPGDYDAVQQNTAWDASGLAHAATAAAIKLDLLPAAVPDGGNAVAGANSGSTSTSNGSLSMASLPAADQGAGQHAAATQTPRFGVLVLAHEKGVAASAAWEAWEAMQGGKAVVRVHLKEGVSTAGLPGEAWVSCRLLPSRIHSQWGCISLTGAILQAVADMLQQHPQLQHVAVASGQDLPVAAVPRDLRPGLSLFGRFQFGRAFDAAARRVASELLRKELHMSAAEGNAWGDALVFHHTWMVLDRQLLLALISKQEELLRVGAVLHERFMQPDVAVAADEFILVTAAMRYGFVKQIVQKKLQPYMSTLRRQHRQATAGNTDSAKKAGRNQPLCRTDRPAKQQRSGADTSTGSRSSRTRPSSGTSSGSRSACAATTSSSSTGPSIASNVDSRSSRSRVLDMPLPPRSLSAPPVRPSQASSGAVAKQCSKVRDAARLKDRPRAVTRSGQAQTQQQPSTSSPGGDDGGPGSPLHDGTHGVLLDCCPTLALFHPTETRHPHEWRNFSECLLVDVNSSRPGQHKLTLLQALALAQPNAALFFRKVAQMQRHCPAQLMSCLKLLWRGKSLPPTVEELPE